MLALAGVSSELALGNLSEFPSLLHRFGFAHTKKQNKLCSKAWKQFSQDSTDVPALLLGVMLLRQIRELSKNS